MSREREKRQVAPRGGGPPHHSPWVVLTTHPGLARKSRGVLTTHPGLARKSRVVNGKILELERRGRDMRMRARMCPAFPAICIHQRRAGPGGRSPAATPQAKCPVRLGAHAPGGANAAAAAGPRPGRRVRQLPCRAASARSCQSARSCRPGVGLGVELRCCELHRWLRTAQAG